MTSQPRNIVIAIVPHSCDAPYLLQWTASTFFHHTNDTIHLVTGPPFTLPTTSAAVDYNSLLDKTVEDFKEKEVRAGRMVAKDVAFNKVILEGEEGTKVNHVLEEFVKDVKADILIIDGHDLDELKRSGRWQGSFSNFCVHHIHCHVIVVRHPHDTHHHHHPH